MRDSEGPRSKRQKQVTATSSSAVGFIQIVDVDPDGRFVQIKNMSDKVSGFLYSLLSLYSFSKFTLPVLLSFLSPA